MSSTLHETATDVALAEQLRSPELLDHDFSRPLSVRLPIPGRYTAREGERLDRSELYPLVDDWIRSTENTPRFVIQGGNRYISKYLDEKGVDHCQLKVSSIDKAPLYNHLLTLLDQDEQDEVLEVVESPLPFTPTRRNLLMHYANLTLDSPFSTPTLDHKLEEELESAVLKIVGGTIEVPNHDILQDILSNTQLSRLFATDRPINFLDDLFYRGRTIYSLAVIVAVFGGNPQNIHVSTIGCDQRSKGLASPFHTILGPDKLYPFENSIRTEQGYWQDTGTEYVFTDMGHYWESLTEKVNTETAPALFGEWQKLLRDWSEMHDLGSDTSLTFPLLWLTVYHDLYDLDLNLEKIIDQKGYKIGSCVPFTLLIDRFISQEETVESRLEFKEHIRLTLEKIQQAKSQDQEGYSQLLQTYDAHLESIDYAGLSSIFEDDPDYLLCDHETNCDTAIKLLSDNILEQAHNQDRPVVVGINGIDGSGKTNTAQLIRAELTALGVPVTMISIDKFTHDHDRRHLSDDAVVNYYSNTFDIESLRKDILEPLRQGRIPQTTFNHADPHNESARIEHSYEFTTAPSIILVEGVFLFRPELVDYFDTRVFLKLPLEQMIQRGIERDVPLFGEDVIDKYYHKYMPAQKVYLETDKPESKADIVLDTSNWLRPKITIKKRHQTQ